MPWQARSPGRRRGRLGEAVAPPCGELGAETPLRQRDISTDSVNFFAPTTTGFAVDEQPTTASKTIGNQRRRFRSRDHDCPLHQKNSLGGLAFHPEGVRAGSQGLSAATPLVDRRFRLGLEGSQQAATMEASATRFGVERQNPRMIQGCRCAQPLAMSCHPFGVKCGPRRQAFGCNGPRSYGLSAGTSGPRWACTNRVTNGSAGRCHRSTGLPCWTI